MCKPLELVLSTLLNKAGWHIPVISALRSKVIIDYVLSSRQAIWATWDPVSEEKKMKKEKKNWGLKEGSQLRVLAVLSEDQSSVPSVYIG